MNHASPFALLHHLERSHRVVDGKQFTPKKKRAKRLRRCGCAPTLENTPKYLHEALTAYLAVKATPLSAFSEHDT